MSYIHSGLPFSKSYSCLKSALCISVMPDYCLTSVNMDLCCHSRIIHRHDRTRQTAVLYLKVIFLSGCAIRNFLCMSGLRRELPFHSEKQQVFRDWRKNSTIHTPSTLSLCCSSSLSGNCFSEILRYTVSMRKMVMPTRAIYPPPRE